MAFKNILFAGIGVMGQYMAEHLLKLEGIQNVYVWNRSRDSKYLQYAIDKGCQYLNESEIGKKDIDLVCLCVSDKFSVVDVLYTSPALITNLREPVPIIDFSTIGRSASLEIYEKMEEIGFDFIDAPVTGGDTGAKNGTLTVIVGAEPKEEVRFGKIFQAVGKKIFYAGDRGQGQAIKSVNQILCAEHMLALCEAFQFAQNTNVGLEDVIEVCSTGAAGSWALANLGPEIAKGNFSPAFMIKHMIKDIEIVREENEELFDRLEGLKLSLEKFQKVDPELGTQGMYTLMQEEEIEG